MNNFREELAWAAGFVDGEGWFGLSEGWARISIHQVDIYALERFQKAVFGLGKIQGPYKHGNGHPIYQYMVNGSYRCQAIVAMLWEFLGPVKREQASRMLVTMKRSNLAQNKYQVPVEIENLRCRRGHSYKENRTKHGQCRECMRLADRKRRAINRQLMSSVKFNS